MKYKMRLCAMLLCIVSLLFPTFYSYIQDQQSVNKMRTWAYKKSDEDVMKKYPIIQDIYQAYTNKLDNSSMASYQLSNTAIYDSEINDKLSMLSSSFAKEIDQFTKSEIIPASYLNREVNTFYPITFGTIQIDEKEIKPYYLSQVLTLQDDVVEDAQFQFDPVTYLITKVIITNHAIDEMDESEMIRIMQSYVAYLKLNNIHDWTYTDGIYESYDARIEVYYRIETINNVKRLYMGARPIQYNGYDNAITIDILDENLMKYK